MQRLLRSCYTIGVATAEPAVMKQRGVSLLALRRQQGSVSVRLVGRQDAAASLHLDIQQPRARHGAPQAYRGPSLAKPCRQ